MASYKRTTLSGWLRRRRGLVAEAERDHPGQHEPTREHDEPAGEAVGVLLHEPDQEGSEETAQVPDRVDERDRARGRAPAREGGRARPERPERTPHPERAERERE